MLGSALEQIGVLSEFGGMARKAFADREAASGDGRRRRRSPAATAFGSGGGRIRAARRCVVRGARLVSATDRDAQDMQTSGYVVVFDDISGRDLRAAFHRRGGEVARRLAHEIKNPLTPIQLSPSVCK